MSGPNAEVVGSGSSGVEATSEVGARGISSSGTRAGGRTSAVDEEVATVVVVRRLVHVVPEVVV